MLTKESSRGFQRAESYPTYEYHSKSDKRTQGICGGSRIVPTPKGYIEVIRYHDEDEHFNDYVKWNAEDHADVSDERLKREPYGGFHGRWRNARWNDEAQRRNLI